VTEISLGFLILSVATFIAAIGYLSSIHATLNREKVRYVADAERDTAAFKAGVEVVMAAMPQIVQAAQINVSSEQVKTNELKIALGLAILTSLVSSNGNY
jgi:hypothetical protein